MVLNSQVYVTYEGNKVAAVVGDFDPSDMPGKFSIARGRALRISRSSVDGGIDDHVVDYEIDPGEPAIIDGVTYSLQP